MLNTKGQFERASDLKGLVMCVYGGGGGGGGVM